MKNIIFIFFGFFLYYFFYLGFENFNWDYISKEFYPTEFYNIKIVKTWKDNFQDNYGEGTYIFTKRFFKNYTLKEEIIRSSRENKKMDELFSFLDNSI